MVVGGESGSWHYDIYVKPAVTTHLLTPPFYSLGRCGACDPDGSPYSNLTLLLLFRSERCARNEEAARGSDLNRTRVANDYRAVCPGWRWRWLYCTDEYTSWHGLIGTTWVGSQTHLGWFTKSISNKYQIREIVKLKVGDVINPNNATDDIRTINTSYDKGNFILCVPTYSTELGSTQPQGTKELTPEGNTILYEEIWKYTTNL